jgi:hypothetical protein
MRTEVLWLVLYEAKRSNILLLFDAGSLQNNSWSIKPVDRSNPRNSDSCSAIQSFFRGTHNDPCHIRWPQTWCVSAQCTLWHLICLALVLTLCSQIYCKWCHLVRISDSCVFISYNAERHTRVGSILSSDKEGEEFNSRPEYWLSCLKLFVFFFFFRPFRCRSVSY